MQSAKRGLGSSSACSQRGGEDWEALAHAVSEERAGKL